MIYLFWQYIVQMFDFPGAGLIEYISFRSALSFLLSIVISMIFGKRLIRMLQKLQIGESIRDLGLEGQMEKKGTPTMGGIIILISILLPTLLFAKLNNIYIILMLATTVCLGLIGFLDDYIKVFRKNKKGLAGKFKIIGQIGIGIIVGVTLYGNPDVVVTKMKKNPDNTIEKQRIKSTTTTIPFVKNNEFDYAWLLPKKLKSYAWLIFVSIVILIVTAVSNGANITDGLDGLATGTASIIGVTLAIFAYLSGNIIFSNYLGIMYLPNVGELVIFISAFIGACIGFLWYNSYPASVFMGDTGSLALGGIIAVFAIAIRKELLIPFFALVFLVENLSVMIQVGFFKYTKKFYGEGRRVFLMAPLHHHYQKKGLHESKIVARFWIIAIMAAIFSIITLKIR